MQVYDVIHERVDRGQPTIVGQIEREELETMDELHERAESEFPTDANHWLVLELDESASED